MRLATIGLSAVLAASSLVVTPQAAAAAAPPAGGMTGAQLTTLFSDYGNTSGKWSGADSTVSALLPDGRVAWLFSDTMIGTVNADFSRPRSTPMINNSLVVQSGSALTATLHGGTSTAPQSLIPSGVSGEWYWIADAVVESSGLKVLVNRYKKTGDGALDVALTGTALATLALPGLTVSNVVDLPLGDKIAWGNALLEDGGYTYIYGSEYVAADNMRFARLARVPTGGLGGAWQFWTGSGWSTSAGASVRLPLSGVGTAFAAQKVGGQFVIVTMESNVLFGTQAVAYTSASASGPFTGPIDLFTAPEPAAREGVIVYDTRLHPELAPDGKLLVSYNVHSLVGDDLYEDARIYRPRFVDLAWPRPAPGPATPAAPGSLTATTNATGAIDLSWPASSGATGYAVYQRDVTAGQTHFARVQRPTGTSTSLGGFKTAHTYEFKVTASNADGESGPSPVKSVAVTIAPPPAPTGVTATAGTDGSIALSWSTVPHAWRYDVLRRDVTAGEAEFVLMNNPSPGSASFTALWLTHGHEYEFVVVASHGGGDSPRSAPVRATARYAVPPAPGSLTATALSDGQIRLNWTGPTQNVYFLIFQRDVTAGETAFTQLPLPAGCCELTAGYLRHGHEYEYKVVASNQGGESPASNVARATSSYPATTPPGTLTAVAGNGQVALTWQPSSTPGSWYWIYQRDVTAGESTFTQLPLPITTCCTMTAGYLTNGHTYEFKVTTIGPAGESSGSSNVVTVKPQLPLPGQVTGLTVTPLGTGEIRLNWTAPGPDLWFWVYQRDVTAGETQFTKLTYPVTECCSFKAGYLKHNHVYEFKVAATNAAGDGPASAVARATAHYNPPGAPTGLKATAAGDGSIDLDWDAPGADLFYWIYMRDVTAGGAFTKSTYPTDRTSGSWGWLVHGHEYEFKVTAVNQGGEGPASATARATAYGGLPAAPTGLTATAGDGQVTLRWNASSTSNVYYWIEHRVAGGTWQRAQYPLNSCCTHTVSYLANGTTYEFRVRATNVHGDSAASNVASARPMPPLPSPPSGLTAAPGDGQVTLRWTASPSPSVYYWIEYRPAGGTWQRLKYPLSTCCTFTVTYLNNGTYYEFRVRATNLSGDSAPSVAAGARPMPPFPQAPSNLRATANGDTAVNLTWNASPTSNVYYWIEYRYSNTTQHWTRATYPVASCCSFTLSMLTPGKSYDFQLRATNLSGDSIASNIASVTLWVTPPAAPQNVRAVPITTGSDVQMYWYGVPNATGYTVEARQCRGGSWSRVGFMITGTYYAVKYAAGCYEYRVIADRYGVYGSASSTKLAFGTVDDYPWKYDTWPIDRYGFWKRQCTSFVASRVFKYYPNPDPPGFTSLNYWHAKNWDEAARKYGGMVSQTPAVGAIAQWNGGDYGHVAWVAGIDGSYIIIEEYNGVNSENYSRRRISASSVDNYLSVM